MATLQEMIDARVAELSNQGYKGAPVVSGARAVAQGASLGFSDEAEAALTAGIQSLMNDEKYSDAYNAALSNVRGDLAAFRKQYPYLSFAAELAGGMAIPGAAMKNVVQGGKTALTAGIRGAGTSAGIGGVAGFGMGEDGFTERANSALMGAGIGGLLGGTTAAAGRTIENLAKRAIGPEKLAAQEIGAALQRDAVPLPVINRAVQRTQASEAPLTLADTLSRTAGAGTNLGGLIDYAATAPGKGASTIRQTAEKRLTGQVGRLADKGRLMFGQLGDYVSETTDRVKGYLGNAAQAYDEVYQANTQIAEPTVISILQRPGVVKDVNKYLKDMGDTLGPDIGISSFYDDAGRIVRAPSLKELHSIIKTFGSPPKFGEAPRKVGDPMSRVAAELNEILKAEIPSFGDVQMRWRSGSDLVEAANLGGMYGKTPSPSLREKFTSFSPEQQDAFRSGMFRSILERMEKARDGRDVLNMVLGSPAARRDFLAIVPKEQRGAVIRRLADEYRLAQTAKASTQNSKTAARMEAAKAFGGGQQEPIGVPDVFSQALYALGLTLDEASDATREKALNKVADMLFSRDPNVQQEAVDKIIGEMTKTQFVKDIVPNLVNRAPAAGTVAATSAMNQ